MTIELQHIFNEFERKIREEDKLNPDKDDPNGKYSFYVPKIRDYLMIYLNEQIVFRNYAERERLYFEKVFNREYLIEATMYYVENRKTRGVTDNTNEKRFRSISDFLIAYNHFFDIVLKLQYTMPVLLTEELSAEIRVRLENNDLLFFTRNTKNDTQQKPISSAFLSESFKTIKEQYFSQQTHDEFVANRFTHYGVIKYAIANMLEFNMNISSIVNLTDRDTKFILSCKPQNALSSKQQSNYINCIMRSIDTYKDYNY